MVERQRLEVEIRPEVAPDGSTMVLVQFRDGWMLIPPEGAERMAVELTRAAMEVRRKEDS